MTTKQFHFVMIGLNCLVAILILGVVFWGNGMISKEAGKLKEAKTENKIIDEQQIALLKAKKDVEKYKDLNEVVKTVVPQDKDQARTVREISKIASESGVALKDIRFQNSNLGQTLAPTSTTTDASGATQKPAQPNLSQVKPIEGINGVFALEVAISSQDTQAPTYSDFIKFLERLENNRRTAHVDKISIKPVEGGDRLTFTITLNAYVKP